MTPRRTTPVAGVVFKFSKMVSVYGSYIEGLVQGDTAPAVSGSTPILNAGQVFAPYQTKQGEIGVKVDAGRIGGSFSLFNSRKPVYSVNTTTFIFGQTGEQLNRGAEFSFFGEAMPGLKVLGGVSWLSAKVGSDEAIGVAKTQVNLGSEWAVPGVPGLWLNGRVVYTGTEYADAANTQQVPAWTRLDVGARYEMPLGSRTLTLRGRIDNLTNRDYWASAGGYPGRRLPDL